MNHDAKNIMVILSSRLEQEKRQLRKKSNKNTNLLKISVSHTTRKPRPNEVDGVDYYFINHEEFKKLIKEGKFYEYAKIFDNYYGTLKETVDKIIKKNDIIFDIDWQELSNYQNLKI